MCGLKGSPSTSVTTSATTNIAALKNMSKPEYMYARTHVLRIFQRVSVLKKKDGANIYLSQIVLCIKTLLMGNSISILTSESYHYALSREMAQGA